MNEFFWMIGVLFHEKLTSLYDWPVYIIVILKFAEGNSDIMRVHTLKEYSAVAPVSDIRICTLPRVFYKTKNSDGLNYGCIQGVIGFPFFFNADPCN